MYLSNVFSNKTPSFISIILEQKNIENTDITSFFTTAYLYSHFNQCQSTHAIVKYTIIYNIPQAKNIILNGKNPFSQGLKLENLVSLTQHPSGYHHHRILHLLLKFSIMLYFQCCSNVIIQCTESTIFEICCENS